MFSFLYKKYWTIGFQLRLYDLLAPQAYLDSISMCVESVQIKKSGVWLDAGCGSGLSLPVLKENLGFTGKYYGIDLTTPGLLRTLEKIKSLEINGCCLLNNFTNGLPFKKSSVDVVIAHFSTYTVIDYEARLRILKKLSQDSSF